MFRKPPLKYNCAQSVIHGYKAVRNDCALNPEDFQNQGGGKAPEGVCGALWAACCIKPGWADEYRIAFKAKAGAIHCRELKCEHGALCHGNVSLAVRLLAGE